jgi:hypothetical protein
VVLIEVAKVRLSNRNDFVKELEYQSSVGVSLRSGYKGNSIMGNVDEVNTAHIHNRLLSRFLRGHDLSAELYHLTSVDIATVASVNQNLSTCIYE